MKIIQSALIIVLLIAATSCRSNGQDSMAAFTEEVYTPKYASGFKIKKAPERNSTLIEVTNPWQGADSVITRLLILRDGETAPAGFDGQVLAGNARRIVAMSSTDVARLDALGASETLVGVSGLDYISTESVAGRRDEIRDIGYEGNVDYELLAALTPDLILINGMYGESAMEPKLRELQIPFMYVGDYLEESPLGKAEWLIAIGEIIGLRDSAESVFAPIPTRYNELKAAAAALPGRPRVIVNAPYGDSWFMPPVNSYAAQLIADAGGEFVYTANTGNSSVPVDMEEAYRLATDADIWINTGICTSLDELKALCPKFSDTRPVVTGRVFNNNRRTNPAGGNDYYESGAINPDVVLRDLIMIFHPGAMSTELTYYKQL